MRVKVTGKGKSRSRRGRLRTSKRSMMKSYLVKKEARKLHRRKVAMMVMTRKVVNLSMKRSKKKARLKSTR